MWLDIKGYEGIYKINENGDVKSIKKLNRRKSDRILKPDINSSGYKRVTLSKNNIQKRFLIHRLVYETFISDIPKGLTINHKDLDKLNNNINNLEIMTSLENNQYKHTTKLDKSKVIAIRNSKLKTKELAELYNVNERTIQRVKTKDRWANI